MKKRTTVGFLVVAVAALAFQAAVCGGGDQPAPAAPSAERGAMLFFVNPNGRPCQMQAEILEGARAQVEEPARIVYVSAERAEDRGTFHRCGVRALPSIFVVDGSGAEVERLPPGVQPLARMLAATGKL